MILVTFEDSDHVLSWKMLYILKSKSCNKKKDNLGGGGTPLYNLSILFFKATIFSNSNDKGRISLETFRFLINVSRYKNFIYLIKKKQSIIISTYK